MVVRHDEMKWLRSWVALLDGGGSDLRRGMKCEVSTVDDRMVTFCALWLGANSELRVVPVALDGTKGLAEFRRG